ncbi:MAG: hypothetical protein ACTSXW_08500 [Candidatus Baldrarchaeia archaeon]
MEYELEVITSGSSVNSPYPYRRTYMFYYSQPLKEVQKIAQRLPAIQNMESIYAHMGSRKYTDFRAYVKSFCKYCQTDYKSPKLPEQLVKMVETKDEEEVEWFPMCLRHESIAHIPTPPSNHIYTYKFSYKNGIFNLEAHVGANRWLIELTLQDGVSKLILTRPSGVSFTYRAQTKLWDKNTAIYKMKLSSLRFGARWIRDTLKWILDPISHLQEANIYIVTPHDEILIPCQVKGDC